MGTLYPVVQHPLFVGHTLTILFKHTISVLNPPHPLVLESEVIQKLELVKI